MNYIKQFQYAVQLINQGNDEEAEKILLELTTTKEISDVVHYRLGDLYNRLGNPEKSYEYHKKVFEINPTFARSNLQNEHPNKNYIYNPPKESVHLDICPLCGADGKPYKSFSLVSDHGFVNGFNPVRTWMKCNSCNHLFADSYPKNIFDLFESDNQPLYMQQRPNVIPLLGTVMSRIKNKVSSIKSTPVEEISYLEVGVGAGEMIAVAKEFGFDVEGLDVRPNYAKNVEKMIKSPIHVSPFEDYKTDKKYDIIVMGDVIEHVLNPMESLKKAESLLKEDAILWISTPNFESAFSMVLKDRDPMWRVCEHINYFSLESMKNALEQFGLTIVDYQISVRFNGSMEIMAMKK